MNIWFTERIDIQSENFKFKLEYEDRFYQGDLLYDHTDIGFSYKLKPRLSLNSNIRLIHEFKENIEQEVRPHLSVDYKILDNLKIKPRLEFRFKDDFSLRYRLKLYSSKKFYKNLHVYVADEIFVTDNIDRNRIYSGLLYKKDEKNLLLYYMLQTKKETMNAIGLSIRLSL